MDAKSGSSTIRLVRESGSERVTVSFDIVPETEASSGSEEEAEMEEEDQVSFDVTVDITKKVHQHIISFSLIYMGNGIIAIYIITLNSFSCLLVIYAEIILVLCIV